MRRGRGRRPERSEEGVVAWRRRALVVLCAIPVLLVCATTAFPAPPLRVESLQPPLIAVLPFENLSASSAPLKEMRAHLMERLRKRGMKLLGEEELLALMKAYRVRYTGGVEQRVAETFRGEAGVGGVLITSLGLYMDQIPPKVTLVSRLARTDAPYTVIWADSVSLSGDDAPGILGLGLVNSVKGLMPRALDRLADSLAAHLLSEKPSTADRSVGTRYRPRGFYHSPVMSEGKRYSVAVLPFVNQSARRYAGELIGLKIIEQLRKSEGFEVLEPGIVRDELLQFRIIFPEGASMADADILFERTKVDLLFTGKVMDYDDSRGPGGAPNVTFFMQVIERQSRQVVWASHSTNRGDDGVFFFGAGRVTTADALASKMMAAVMQRIH